MAGSPLDMSLDDLIKNNKQSGGRGQARGAPSSRRGAAAAAGTVGPIRRAAVRQVSGFSPYSAKPVQRAVDGPWQHDLFEEDATPTPVRSMGIETGTKLYISNLDYGVSNEDIKELFSEVGDLKRCGIHYDRSGRSKGTAEVVYSRRTDALAAIKRYNDVQLDGKPMKIELIGTNLSVPAAASRVANGVAAASRGGRALGNMTRGRGMFQRGRGRGRGRGRRSPDKTAAELDADLDSYHAESMEA